MCGLGYDRTANAIGLVCSGARFNPGQEARLEGGDCSHLVRLGSGHWFRACGSQVADKRNLRVSLKNGLLYFKNGRTQVYVRSARGYVHTLYLRRYLPVSTCSSRALSSSWVNQPALPATMRTGPRAAMRMGKSMAAGDPLIHHITARQAICMMVNFLRVGRATDLVKGEEEVILAGSVMRVMPTRSRNSLPRIAASPR
jgi:hypothetical protein